MPRSGVAMGAFRWIENTPPSVFVREDFYAYFVLLIFHAWGMAMLVGGGLVVSLRLMGVASGARLERFAVFFPWMKVGTVMAILSGIGLLLGYPAKALTNWVFALKFACFIAAALTMRHAAYAYFPLAASGKVVPAGSRGVGAAAFLLWIGGVACGKLLLYTNTVLMVSDG
ncbi:hypothetical protein GRI89_02945 [Altererythrobacter salegens]|uniref:Uncharacterized protein n=1 Tax=Croceibacterium salegens TaxID=1737568 RepID=A0A6I4SSG9_9SPHN|nr:hypothetical protein [Croceibacterium salegens]MXO58499.1 hypothetical protein [Croceibacterium salegens]